MVFIADELGEEVSKSGVSTAALEKQATSSALNLTFPFAPNRYDLSCPCLAHFLTVAGCICNVKATSSTVNIRFKRLSVVFITIESPCRDMDQIKRQFTG
jgi:hypothetical protein